MMVLVRALSVLLLLSAALATEVPTTVGPDGQFVEQPVEQPIDQIAQWPQWRGPLGTGVAPRGNPPVEWSEKKNVRWKVGLPGRGHSTPVIWGDRIYLTAAAPFGERVPPVPETAPGAHDNVTVDRHHEFIVLALDAAGGNIVWQRTVHKELPHEGGHATGSLASASPATDGQRVYAFFGSRGLHCLDASGEVLWKKTLGRMLTKHAHGEGSSPVLHGDTLVVNWDHEGQSFVVAFDGKTGDEIWRIPRNELTSWSSPIVVDHGGQSQVIVAGTPHVRAYNLINGKVIWECGTLSHNVVATPVAGHGMVWAASSYEIRAMVAIRLDGAKGDITDSDRVAWTRTLRTPYVPSPLLYDESLYFLRHYQGILSRLEAKSGKERSGPFRLPGIRNVYASPVGAAAAST